MVDLDLATVLGVWRHLEARYGTRVLAKARSPLMTAIAWFLAAVRILPRRAFLEDFTTTIGHRIYVPFDPRAPADAAECWRRFVLVVHEHQHVVQWRRGPVGFVLTYLLSPRRRAAHEAEAYAGGFELAAWAGRPLPSARDTAQRLRHYGCGPQAIAEAEALLLQAAERARRGEIRTEAAQVAVAFLQGAGRLP